MSNDNSSTIKSRRTFLKTAGGASVVFLAGCDGGGGDDTPTGGDDTPMDDDTPTATPEPESFNGQAGITAFEMAAMPVIHAFRQTVTERSDGRFTGNLRNFGTSQLIVQSQLAGSVDTGVYSPGNSYNANIAGNDLRCITTTISGTDYVLTANADQVDPDGIEGLRHVVEEGLRFGIGGRGGLSHIQPLYVLSEEGISDDSINYVEIGGSSDRTAALAAGQIAVSATHLEQHNRLVDSDDVNVKALIDFRDYMPNMVQEALWVQQSWLEDDVHDEFAQDLVTSILQNNQRATNDKEWLFGLTEQYQANPLSQESLESTYSELSTMDAWPTTLNREGYQVALDTLAAGDLLDPSNVSLDDILVNEYVEAAQDAL